MLRDAEPNAAHRAIVAVEKAGKLLRLVTQNIDGLHHKAGTSRERIIEIHGSSLRAACIDCGAEHDRERLHERLVRGEIDVSRTATLRRPVKPATISFGQAMPERETGRPSRRPPPATSSSSSAPRCWCIRRHRFPTPPSRPARRWSS